MKFEDIPKFTEKGDWECNYRFDRLDNLIKEWEEDYNLELNPDFQRGHVWTEKQQIAYIEFFLQGGKTGRIVYFNCPYWDTGFKKDGDMNMVCVDGLQRITALRDFYNNKIKVFGYYFKDFKGGLKGMTDYNIRINVNCLKTKADVLKWYLEMNTGGIVHSESEIERVKKMLKEEVK